MFCQKCGSQIPNDVGKCPKCGALREGYKYCRHCGEAIEKDCIICPKCGKQVSEITAQQPNIVINNSNQNTNINRFGGYGRPKNKWVALFLCVFLGIFGAHKFYEGKTGMGVIYLFTCGLVGIGCLVDFIAILCKPNPYFV